jgi:hypothetical protein
MSLKKVNRLDEAPWDFLKGAAGAAGNKIANSAAQRIKQYAQPMQDIVQAGQAASQAGNLDKAVRAFVQAYSTYAKVLKAVQQNAPTLTDRVEPTMGRQPTQQAAPATPQEPKYKPRMTPGKYGYEYKFEQFMRDQAEAGLLNEGPWDFLKGAAQATGQKISQSGVGRAVSDIKQAGAQASQQADARRASEKTTAQLTASKQQAQQALQQVLAAFRVLGQNGPKALQAAVAKYAGQQSQQIMNVIMKNALKAGMKP